MLIRLLRCFFPHSVSHGRYASTTVVSTVEPGRKPTTDGEENGDEPMNGVILSENNIEAVSKENNKMDEEANGSAETIDTVASKLTEESAPEAAPTAEPAAAIDREKPIEADAKEANSIEVDATASEEPIAVIEAPVVDDAIKDGGDIASEEPATVAATDVVTENKTDDDKVLVDEAKPEEIAQIIESLDLPPAAVEKIEKPSTPKHARDEDDDLDGELENGERSAKKIKLDLNDDIDAAITSLPESEIPVVEPKANGDKIDDEPIAEPTPIVDVPVEAAKIEAPTDAKIETIEKASVAEPVVEPVVEAPIEATPKTDAVEEVVAPEPTPAEEIAVDATKTEPVIESETPVVDSSAIEPAVTAEIAPVPTTPATEPVEEPAVVEPKPIDDVVVEDEPAKIEPSVEPDAQVPVKPVEAVTAEPEPVETAAPEVAPTLDIPVSEFLAENLTALIPTDLLPAVNESDMAPAVVAPEPNVINQESMTVEEPETPVAPIDEVVEENAEKMDAAPINDEQMDVDDAADPPMDL